MLLWQLPSPRKVSPLSLSYITKKGEQGLHHGCQGVEIHCLNELQEYLDGQQNNLLVGFT